jgi:hypothetical protein
VRSRRQSFSDESDHYDTTSNLARTNNQATASSYSIGKRSTNTKRRCNTMLGCVGGARRLKILAAVVRWTMTITWVLGLIAIVGTKKHYTIDVFIAAFLTWFIWSSFHTHVRHGKLKRTVSLLKWLEADVILEMEAEAFEMYMSGTPTGDLDYSRGFRNRRRQRSRRLAASKDGKQH